MRGLRKSKTALEVALQREHKCRVYKMYIWEYTDCAFKTVIRKCASTPRPEQKGTWIVPSMQKAYCALHAKGYAHSVEAWLDGEIVGGLYGVGLEHAFFGESMFHTVPEASRAALFGLVQLLRLRKVVLLDCQQETPHMMNMGAVLISMEEYHKCLNKAGLGYQAQTFEWLPWTEHYSWTEESSSWSVKS